MERNIERLKDHVILIGFGQVGHEAAKAWHGDNLVVVEEGSGEVRNRTGTLL